MKQILYLIALLIIGECSAHSQTLLKGVVSMTVEDSCSQGNDDPQPEDDRQYDPIADTLTSGGISADPNEIIGPTGFYSLHWVSINDIYNYTILLENVPEIAIANEQKVDVRFTFDDKAYIKGFGLSSFGFVRTSVINQT